MVLVGYHLKAVVVSSAWHARVVPLSHMAALVGDLALFLQL